MKFYYWYLSAMLTFITSSVFAMSDKFTQEHSFTPQYQQQIEEFWKTGTFDSFTGIDNVSIAYAAFIQDAQAPCLVISQGRSESYLKYQELLFDLSQLNINLFILDHRGQGLSGKMQNNRHKGYVEKFDDYAGDLKTFIEQIVTPNCDLKPQLLAHSMGGAIAIRTMQKYPELIDSALLASPMIAINSGGLPLWLAKGIIFSGQTLNNWFSDNAWYFLGQSDYQAPKFENSDLMQSKVRFDRFTTLYKQQKSLQLGGVTFQWLAESLKAKQNIFNEINKLKTPITILQAGDDTVVDNEAQNDFCQALANHNASCQPLAPIVIQNAKHELFFEQDQYRNQALNTVVDWLKL